MSELTLNEAKLLERLKAHPQLMARFESILAAVENESGELRKADAAELRLIDEMRRFGQEALSAWGVRQAQRASSELEASGRVWREGKKNSAGTAPLATSK